jgi:hypothetical protein
MLAVLMLRTQTPQGSLRLRQEGFCEWVAAPARAAEMNVAGLFGAFGWLVLRLKPRQSAGRALTLVLAPDAAAPDEMRRLRVWLKLAAPRADLNSGGVRWS